MHLYLGSGLVKKFRADPDVSGTLFQSETILVRSSVPYLKIPLDGGRLLLVWGAIYGVKDSDGNSQSLVVPEKRDRVLRELFKKGTVENVQKGLEGDYVALFIQGPETAVLFCDEFNRTEIFFTRTPEGTVVSTDLEPVIGEVKEVHYSQPALANLLTIYGYYAPKKHTIYEEVHRLGVGERVVFDGQAARIEKTQFVPLEAKAFDEEDHKRYAMILEDAVRIRSSAACNWVFLSSGWDSTSLLAILVKLYGADRVRAVIGEMRYSERAGIINQFEIDRAEKIANYYGVDLDVVPFDLTTPEASDYWSGLQGPLRKRHIYTNTAYNYFRLTEHILERGGGEDAVFAGEISDGVHNLGFSQYATVLEHPDMGFREYSDKMASYLFGPSFFKSILEGKYSQDAVYQFIRSRYGSASFDDARPLSEKERRIAFFASFFLRPSRVPFYGLCNTHLLTRDGADAYQREFSRAYLEEPAREATPESLYSWILYLYNTFHWQGGTVRSLGARLEIAGRRIRVPFGDSRMKYFLSEMPEDWGRGLELRPTKYPLKRMLEKEVDYPMHLQTGPHSYLYDVDPQFSHASEVLYGSHVSGYFKELLGGYPFLEILDGQTFNLGYMRQLVDDYRNGMEMTGARRKDLMALLMLCATGWY